MERNLDAAKSLSDWIAWINNTSSQKYWKISFTSTSGFWCSAVGTSADWGSEHATVWSSDSTSYPSDTKYALWSLDTKTSNWGTDETTMTL